MKKFLLIFSIFMCVGCAFTQQYGVYRPENYRMSEETGEKILFILDFSNSMNEYLENRPKSELMVQTVKNLLRTIPPNVQIGLRVYGHRGGFTAIDGCKASKCTNPIMAGNAQNITSTLDSLHPNGMTPITYSLKQAIRYDFAGFGGKKHIILLTDGGENCDESPCKFAMELIKTRHDVTIDVIAFNIDDEDDLAQLECASLVTSGKFYTANTACELASSLSESLSSVKEVEAKIIQH